LIEIRRIKYGLKGVDGIGMMGVGKGNGFWSRGGVVGREGKHSTPIFTIRGSKYRYYSKYTKHYVIILFEGITASAV
jgi:hypothetical protein